MHKGPICPCPECRNGDIIALDKQLYTCTSCHRTWDLEELYKTLWLDRLQKLIERRQIIKNPSLSSDHLEMRIEHTRHAIMDIEILLEALENKLSMMDLDPDNPEFKLIEGRFEENKRHLTLYHKRLQMYMKMQKELTDNENG